VCEGEGVGSLDAESGQMIEAESFRHAG
jgi:hypothetical protein